ncbi:MAG: peptidoglycan editing factor PgeF [bacterium]
MKAEYILKADCFKSFPAIQFGMSTRKGGVSPEPFGMNLSFSVGDAEENVRRNRELFFGALEIRLDALATQRQIHSGNVQVVRQPGNYHDCDAMITSQPGVFLCVSVADCVPIFLFDEKNKVVAGIHAGWRGTKAGIVSNTINLMKKEFGSDPAKIVAYIGPSASACCYEVGGEVASQFISEFVIPRDGKILLDLKAANTVQLVQSGVSSSSIEVSSLCTITETQLLHSFRRDGVHSGRMMGVIGLL